MTEMIKTETATLDLARTVALLDHVSTRMIEQVDILTDADLAIGDGDHGIGMQRGFEGALESLRTSPPETIEEALRAVGSSILSRTGGAAGAIFGTLFRSGSKALAGKNAIDAGGFADFLETGLDAVLKRGGVTEGQKTIIDALAPAARAARISAGGSLPITISMASRAADDGVEATKGMIATTGKARSLGKRSIGHPDPGAISVSLILKAMDDFVRSA
ncbi:dihydroxyacetone kinase subunit DhaL [Agrobacterium sp. 22-214-1]